MEGARCCNYCSPCLENGVIPLKHGCWRDSSRLDDTAMRGGVCSPRWEWEDRNSRPLKRPGVRAGIGVLADFLLFVKVSASSHLSQVMGLSVLRLFLRELFMWLSSYDHDFSDTSANGLGPIFVFFFFSPLQSPHHSFDSWTGRVLGVVRKIIAWLHGMSQFLTSPTQGSSAHFLTLCNTFRFRGARFHIRWLLSVFVVMLLGYTRKSFFLY